MLKFIKILLVFLCPLLSFSQWVLTSQEDYTYEILETNDGSYVFTAQDWSSSDPFFYKIDSNGCPLWERDLGIPNGFVYGIINTPVYIYDDGSIERVFIKQ